MAISAKLLDITHKSYGFSDDLIEASYQLMNINTVRLVLVEIIISFIVMCKDSR